MNTMRLTKPLEFVTLTDRGLRRKNADAVFGEDNLFIVADGVGIKGNSDLASKMTVDLVQQSFFAQIDLVHTIKRAHLALKQHNLKHAELPPIGTTIVAAACSNIECNIAWVGDSRAYLVDVNSQTIKLLTEDHSLVNELLKKGAITPEEARQHPKRNAITRSIGLTQNDDIQVDSRVVQWSENQILLLCSDGISDYMTDEMIMQCLLQPESQQDLAKNLVNKALYEGSRDNISVVLITSPVCQDT